jgi:hypothetical protein
MGWDGMGENEEQKNKKPPVGLTRGFERMRSGL